MSSRGDPYKTFLIVCEGEKTEPNYFLAFPLKTTLKVHVLGAAMNTESIIDEAVKQRNMAKKRGINFDQVWCVYDKDSFPNAKYNDAYNRAKKEGINVAYSNEAFELWYLLHYDYITSGIDRKQMIKKLCEKLGHKYKKNSEDMYDILKDKQNIALRNAKKLYDLYSHNNLASENPSTTIFILVEELSKYIRD